MTSQNDVIRILLVDDHDMVRQGLAMFLAAFEDLDLIGEASNGLQAVEMCDQLNPQVILMDLVMPEMDGIEATAAIKEKHPDIKILILTSFKDEEKVQAALKADAQGYILKNISIDDLAESIRSVYAGQITLSPEATEALVGATINPPELVIELTKRELEVMAALISGLNNPEIAENLGVSRSTIKTHVSSIFAKLGVSSRVEAVTYAIKHKLVT